MRRTLDVRRVIGSRSAALASAGVALAGAVLVTAGCGSSDDKYGTTPSFLPTSAISADSVLTGTVGKPALTSDGDGVLVRLAGGSVLMSITGPVVPGEGLPVQKESTTCTWTVTMSSATGRVPLSIAQFTALDHLGGLSHPAVLSGARLPASVASGRTVRFQVRTVMRTGEGMIRWAPDATHVVAAWDFTVEND